MMIIDADTRQVLGTWVCDHADDLAKGVSHYCYRDYTTGLVKRVPFIKAEKVSRGPKHINTAVKAYIEPNHYRSGVQPLDDHTVVIAEIKRLDAVAPPQPYDYIGYHVQQWVPGQPDHADYWLNAEGVRVEARPF